MRSNVMVDLWPRPAFSSTMYALKNHCSYSKRLHPPVGLPYNSPLVLGNVLLTGVGLDVAVVADVLLQREPGQVQVLDNLHRLDLLPPILKIVRRPTVWKNENKFRNKSVRSIFPLIKRSSETFAEAISSCLYLKG